MASRRGVLAFSVNRCVTLRGAALVLVFCGPQLLRAQRDVSSVAPENRPDAPTVMNFRRARPTGCLAAIPADRMQSVPVFLHAFMHGDPKNLLQPQADLMAQNVAIEMRRLLGETGSSVPSADSSFVWYSVPTELTLMSHRNGDLIARPIEPAGDYGATLMLVRAFEAARATSGTLIIYPDDFVGDSAAIDLTLSPAGVDDIQHRLRPGETIREFMVFTLMEPQQSPALPLPNQRPPSYPAENERSRVEGSVLMQFVVDTTGFVDGSTIHELWPVGEPRLRGDPASAHEAFVRSTTAWLRNFRFSPMRIGTCAVRQRVQFPLEFKVP
jgi:hypothetical protein